MHGVSLQAIQGMAGDQNDEMLDEDEGERGVIPSEDDEPESEEGVDSDLGGQFRNFDRRVRPVELADLDSAGGRLVTSFSHLKNAYLSSARKQFIAASVEYLLCTTYECSDNMTISSLLAYLNAAMPPDKHEDFDTAEVTKTAAQLHEMGRLVFEGDVLHRLKE